ncbi:hypothetical protein [Hymenobacter lapidiphilus]|uniref:DUF1795 domain-containing protein n=1 Tax=Hymenobacter lapidiphilus TaxID=2608003 RepID=A0A7Y7U7U5_9BACT|nr:hypothetical protein [Hymenobacter lapidiphilus]NVO33134.1 hypothetical protein [Hymenobacter lapidiphilus]
MEAEKDVNIRNSNKKIDSNGLKLNLPIGWKNVPMNDSNVKAFKANCTGSEMFCDNIVIRIIPNNDIKLDQLLDDYVSEMNNNFQKLNIDYKGKCSNNNQDIVYIKYNFNEQNITIFSTMTFVRKNNRLFQVNTSSGSKNKSYDIKNILNISCIH